MPQSVSAQRVVLTSFFVDLLDIIVNLTVTLITGSVVMAAELIQGVSDLIASGLLLIGLKRPKSESYHWTLASALMMLLVASTVSFYLGLQRFLHPHAIEQVGVAYLALSVSAISNGYAFLLSLQRMLGKGRSIHRVVAEFNDSSLIMTKNTFVLDLMGMSAAVVGLIALSLYQRYGDLRFDGVGAMGIGIVLGLLSLHLVLNIKKMAKKKVRHQF